MDKNNNDLLLRTVNAAKVVSIVTGIKSIIQFLTQILLVRILMPRIFGQFVFVQMIVGLFELFTNIQGRKAVIRQRTNMQQTADVAFTLKLILSIAAMIILIISAPMITSYKI